MLTVMLARYVNAPCQRTMANHHARHVSHACSAAAGISPTIPAKLRHAALAARSAPHGAFERGSRRRGETSSAPSDGDHCFRLMASDVPMDGAHSIPRDGVHLFLAMASTSRTGLRRAWTGVTSFARGYAAASRT
jgi:hypothetical protein